MLLSVDTAQAWDDAPAVGEPQMICLIVNGIIVLGERYWVSEICYFLPNLNYKEVDLLRCIHIFFSNAKEQVTEILLNALKK